MHYKTVFARVFIATLCMTIVPGAFAQTPLYKQSSEVNNLMVEYQADFGSLSRFYFTENSPERRDRLRKLQRDFLQQLQQLKYESLPVGSKADYILFKRDLEDQLRSADIEENEFKQVMNWFPFAEKIYAIEKSRRRGTQPESQKLAAAMNDLTEEIEKTTKALDKEKSIDIALTRRAQGIVRGLQAALKSVQDFYVGYDPMYTWWMPEPYKKLDAALAANGKAWEAKTKSAPAAKDDGSGIVGYPVGREELIRQLQGEMIPYTPEELVDIANAEFAWCDAEMLKASKEMGFG